MPWYFYGTYGPVTAINPTGPEVGMVVPSFIPFNLTPPSGYLFCDGASYPKAGVYAALYAKIGNLYGSTVSNFNVPDLSGRMPRGIISSTGGIGNQFAVGNSALSGGGVFGSSTHTHSFGTHDHAMPSHAHGFSANHTHNVNHTHNGEPHGHPVTVNLNASLQIFNDGDNASFNTTVSPASHNHPPVSGSTDNGVGFGVGAATNSQSTFSTGIQDIDQLDLQSGGTTTLDPSFTTGSGSNVPPYFTISFLIKT